MLLEVIVVILDFIMGILFESYELLNKMSPYLLFGFFFAGLLRVFFSPEKVARHLGKGKTGPVIKAALIGIPLPLCSCGVIPTAISLRRQGASKGATLSFLISTPTTGVDSILATYSLLGPLFAVYRVVSSFVAGVFSGLLANFFMKETSRPLEAGNTCNLCDVNEPHLHNIFEKIKFLFHYAFVELLEGISQWLLLGILIGGTITYLIPHEFIKDYLGSGWQAMIVMLIVGIPIYVCATGSIPIVAALMFKGMSPGAGMVFLLAGPATNAVTITVLARELGKKAVAIYLISISIASILLGMLLNQIWGMFALQESLLTAMPKEFLPRWMEIGSSLILLSLITLSFLRGKLWFLKGKGDTNMKEDLKGLKKVILKVPDMTCQHCVKSIKGALNGVKGVRQAEITLKDKTVKVLFEEKVDQEGIIKAINSAGYEVKDRKEIIT
ncbi:MAG: SO_0444 family Cu/Zn efflux transporter [Deltaproteobacteria bacterium]|nr:SO_0444 family Cu/Zn efflux transporter [Deltaproteobacteria bacterium]